MIKKDNNKKANNKKANNKKANNKKTLVIIIACVLVSASVLSMTFGIIPATTSKTTLSMSDYIDDLSITHTVKAQSTSNFHLYLTPDDIQRLQNNFMNIDGIRILLNESNSEQLIEDLKPNSGTVVIYPVFTSAAYKEPGFYTYFAGKCDQSCVTDLSFENPEFQFTSSGATAQILYHVGYDFLTDVQVDQNPEILENYETVILLHNEYVTQKQFDAISIHPNLIFLHPNALYALVTVDYDTNSITLIQGHDYPPENPMKNGFNYEIEQKFHDYEYDTECSDWKFIEIVNGFHLNCYPESIILDNLEILKKMKEL